MKGKSKKSTVSGSSGKQSKLLRIVRMMLHGARRISFFSRRKKSRRQGSLVGRFQGLLIGWGLVLYLVAVSGFWLISNKVIHSHLEQDASLWMTIIMKVVEPAYASSSATDFASVASYAKDIPEISYIQIFNEDGSEILEEYKSEAFGVQDIPLAKDAMFQDSIGPQVHINDLSVVISQSAFVPGLGSGGQGLDAEKSGGVVTHIRMGLDFGTLQAIRMGVIVSGSLLVLILFLIIAIVGRRSIRHVLKPLLDLREALDRLARGETDVWVDQGGDEEIVAISSALNSTITAIKGRDEALRRLADYDALTGLINKRSFNGILEKERHGVNAGEAAGALLFIDLDQFKFVNDSLGHAAGDKLLVQISELLKNRMRNDDVVCRLGGDEFAVLARAVDEKGAIEIASSIVKSMEDFLFIEQGKSFNIYCSVGVAFIESNSFTAEDIFSQADMACYSAKAKGRNQYQCYHPAAVDQNRTDIGWSQRIVSALTGNNFVLHYQPIINLLNETEQRYEVLPRMCEGSDELVLPKMFIPIAERFGLVTEIDYWVIRASMEKLEQMNAEGKYRQFHINLSGQVFVDPDFVGRIVTMLERHSISADQMIFELKERVIIDNMTSVPGKVKELIAYGFDFAIDDFGSGVSSYSYLKNMPSGYVKIEGGIIERMAESEFERVMVRSMVDVAKTCGKKVVAEHVANQKTYDLLKLLGVDYVQGYFLGRPSPVQLGEDTVTEPEAKLRGSR